MNENLPNGISQIHAKQPPPLSRHFNGLGSSHSSRDPSPLARFQHIPSSQLPPSRAGVPSSQLPPARQQQYDNVNILSHNYANLNISGLNATNVTPFSSPKVQSFSTSTPVTENKEKDATIDNGVVDARETVSVTTNIKQGLNSRELTPPMFTHSATSQFTNVTRNTLPNSNNQLPQRGNKGGENVQRAFDTNLFTATMPSESALSSGKSSEQLNTNMVYSAAVRPPNPTTMNSNQVPLHGTQSFGKVEQPQTSQVIFPQKPMGINQNLFHTTPSQFPQSGSNNNAPMYSNQVFPANTQQNFGMNLPQTRIPASEAPRSTNMPFQNPQTYGSLPNLSRPNIPGYSQMPPQSLAQNPTVSSQNFSQTSYQSVNSFPPPTTSNLGQTPPIINQTSTQPYQNTPPMMNQNQASRTHLYNNRYPPQQQIPSSQSFQQPQPTIQASQQFQYSNTQTGKPLYPTQSVTQGGFNKLWGRENYDLLQIPYILPQNKLEPPKISLGQDFLDAVNCSADIFRCTMTKIPETTSLLQKSRLPLGVLIHPFKDLNHLPVIQCNTIVRCRACRTYINPFVFFADSKRWKCNLCYRINDLPDEFQFDPVSKTYGDPSRRPEVKSSTIEYIAPAEYMIRPPQPAVYLFLMDVSRLAVESGYLHSVCSVLSSELTNLPGDARTQIGFVAYDSALHFYSLSEGQNQPHEMTVLDIDDVFLPCPDNLLVNLQDRMELISDLLTQLPTRYNNTYDTNSALGAALQVAYKMMSATGGRVTVFQVSLPNVGPGMLTAREDPNQRSSAEVPHLNPANDFYKRLALECSGQQIAVDLFVLNSQYVDLATISGISRFSGGCIHHIPLFRASRQLQNEAFERNFRRYVTRKIGFEAVMRIRCTRGLSIHTFHGNFFVRSTDLLSLPNINPDAGFGMQVAIEENLTDVQTVCFQAALLYTSSKGERRIRVHTLCLPVANNLPDVINSADQQCIIGLLSKMAVDRSMQSSLSDAREAFLNVAIDILSSYKLSLNMASGISGLMAPDCLKLLPLYISALLKNMAFRIGTSTRLDDRVKAMCDMKTKPLPYLMQFIYPDLFPVHNLEEHNVIVNEDDEVIHQAPRLQLTARSMDSHGAYLMDLGEHMLLFVCSNVSVTFLNNVFGAADFNALSDEIYELPALENQQSKKMHAFLNYLNDDKPFPATLQVIRENNPNKILFYERLIEDRLENSLSYHEFLQHIKTQVK